VNVTSRIGSTALSASAAKPIPDPSLEGGWVGNEDMPGHIQLAAAHFMNQVGTPDLPARPEGITRGPGGTYNVSVVVHPKGENPYRVAITLDPVGKPLGEPQVTRGLPFGSTTPPAEVRQALTDFANSQKWTDETDVSLRSIVTRAVGGEIVGYKFSVLVSDFWTGGGNFLVFVDVGLDGKIVSEERSQTVKSRRAAQRGDTFEA
jgi:hypothetical protein